MRRQDWSGMSGPHLEASGWPKGMDEETAEWLCRMCERILAESSRPLDTFEVYERIRWIQDKCMMPKTWRMAVVYDWLLAAVSRALRSLGATQVWVPEEDPNDPWRISKKSVAEPDDVFICGSISKAGKKRATYCPKCIPAKLRAKMGESWVDTWRVGCSGWTSAPVCDECKIAISVVVDKK